MAFATDGTKPKRKGVGGADKGNQFLVGLTWFKELGQHFAPLLRYHIVRKRKLVQKEMSLLREALGF